MSDPASYALSPGDAYALGYNDGSARYASREELIRAAHSSGQNIGHGHVFPRPDGIRARCGGPGLCPDCSADKVRRDEAAQ